MPHKIALIGFGVVGQGFAEILWQKGADLAKELGEEIQIVGISDLMKGSIYQPDGLDLAQVLQVVRATGNLDSYGDEEGLVRGWDSLQMIQQSQADTVIEVTFTDVKTGQPGIDHCKAAIQNGKHVVTSNKGPLALAYRELKQLAKQNGVRIGYEGTVMSGTPALRLPLTSLYGNDIGEIRGILNGTTNYMLTRMEEGLTYEDALQEAQTLGYAEADPTNDVKGYDVLYKVLILAAIVMKAPLTKEQVICQGIDHLTQADIKQAKAEGKRWKLIAQIRKGEEGVIGKVAPEMVSMTDPLAGVSGATNAITYECDLLGSITLIGAGAGKEETGFSLLIDLINIIRKQI